MKIYKYEGQTIWQYEYYWTTDYQLNRRGIKGQTVTTKKYLEEVMQFNEIKYGCIYWNVKKRHATEEQATRFLKTLNDWEITRQKMKELKRHEWPPTPHDPERR